MISIIERKMGTFIDRKMDGERLLVILGSAILLLPPRVLDKTIGCAERLFDKDTLTKHNIIHQRKRRQRGGRTTEQQTRRKIKNWFGKQQEKEYQEVPSEIKFYNHRYSSSCNTTCKTQINKRTRRMNTKKTHLDNPLEIVIVFFAFVMQFTALGYLCHNELNELQQYTTSLSYFFTIPCLIRSLFSILLIAGIGIWALLNAREPLYNEFIIMKDTYNVQIQEAMKSIRNTLDLSITRTTCALATATATTCANDTLNCLDKKEDSSPNGKSSSVEKEATTTTAAAAAAATRKAKITEMAKFAFKVVTSSPMFPLLPSAFGHQLFDFPPFH